MADPRANECELRVDALQRYLSDLWGRTVRVERMTALGETEEPSRRGDAKRYGYGEAVRLDCRVDGEPRRAVLQTVRPGPFGHQRMADRAAILLWSHGAYNRQPRHVRSYDVGGFAEGDALVSLGRVREMFLLTEYVEGAQYAEDIAAIRRRGALTDPDERRADALCDFLLEIHGESCDADPTLYTRRVRELVGHSECIAGLVDHYPADDPVATPGRLQAIERRCLDWRWRIKHRTHRARAVHGDFHPWNILFDADDRLRVLDRSRGSVGEPADDVTAITINYLFEAARSTGGFAGPFATLHRRFWDRYLDRSGDQEMLEVAPPFLAFRALVLANPVWYPELDPAVRAAMVGLTERVLDHERLEIDQLERWLGTGRGA
jgi:hypothetical protein